MNSSAPSPAAKRSSSPPSPSPPPPPPPRAPPGRGAGARMLVRRDGSFWGTIGGGCGEAEVWSEAMGAHRDGQARLVQVDLTTPTDGEDKICAGVMDVFVEPVLPA